LEITELALPSVASNEGAKGFLHPDNIKSITNTNNILIQPPFQITPARKLRTFDILP